MTDLRRLVWRYSSFLSISWLLYIDFCVRVCVCVLNSACGDMRAFLTARACFSFCANVDLRVCL